MLLLSVTKVGAGVVLALPVAGVAGVIRLLQKCHASVGTAPPTQAMLIEEDTTNACALFRHLPELADKLAWRSLGASVTPVQHCTFTAPSGANLDFFVKREDLMSPLYGGNKVRTLQHQLATIEARIASGDASASRISVLGTGGSNQVLATVVHSRDRLPTITPIWLDKDVPDLDNTLNMLSVLSFPTGPKFQWGEPLSLLKRLIPAAFSGDEVVLTAGGNCPAGVLGQVGGALELAEQVARGECPDPNRIYVALGSSCTTSGLIMGVALARHLELDAFKERPFKIVAAPVHEAFAMLQAKVGIHRAKLSRFIPLTVMHTLTTSCVELTRLGGPDLLADALSVLQDEVIFPTDLDVVGIYGGHSELSRIDAQAYDASGKVVDATGARAPPLWVCGHFVAKAFTPMVRDLQDNASGQKVLLWQTKSAVQPRGTEDEWASMLEMNDVIKKWADAGNAESALRPGSVDTVGGEPSDYRQLMKQL